MTPATGKARKLPQAMAPEEKLALAEAAVLDVKAADPVVLDLRELTVITDYFVICHGTSRVHTRAIADRVLQRFEEQRVRPFGSEGYQQGEWVLLDFGDVVVHILAEEARDFYGLERLWSDAPRRNLAPAGDTSEEGRPEEG